MNTSSGSEKSGRGMRTGPAARKGAIDAPPTRLPSGVQPTDGSGMMSAEDNEGGLVETIVAEELVAFAFMREVAFELARQSADPGAWVKGFIARLHGRHLPQNEAISAEVQKRIDRLAEALERRLQDSDPPPGAS